MPTHPLSGPRRRPELWSLLALDTLEALAEPRDARDPDAWHAAALAAERRGEAERALRCCATALEHAPDHVGARLTRAAVHAARGERMSALASLEEVRALAPGWSAAEHLVRALGGADFSAPLLGEVVELFDRYAPRFERHLLDELEYQGHLAVPRAALEAAPGERLVALDLGCGSGLCAPALRHGGRVAHLTGVDVSPAMVREAERSGSYDVLLVAELVYALATRAPASADLLVAADVLGYLGELRAVLEEAAQVLRPGGVFAFSVEAAPAGRVERFALQPSRRCCYALDYLRAAAEAAGLELARHDELALRREAGRAVAAHLLVLRRPDGASASA